MELAIGHRELLAILLGELVSIVEGLGGAVLGRRAGVAEYVGGGSVGHFEGSGVS